MEPPELKNKVEAILFAAGKKTSPEYISRLCRANKDDVLKALQELKSEYEAKNSSLLVSDEGEFWKITVKEPYSPIVRKIVPEAELTRTMIETLAVIAWKAPVLQSEVIRIRTNKAYDHIAEIESAGFISREKHGRTQIIKLTQRFYDYFDVHNEKEIKDKFQILNEKLEKAAERKNEKAAEQAKASEQAAENRIKDEHKPKEEQKNETNNIVKMPEVQQQDEIPKQQ